MDVPVDNEKLGNIEREKEIQFGAFLQLKINGIFLFDSFNPCVNCRCKNIEKTNSDCEPRTVIVCGVKNINKRQARLQMLAEAFNVGERGGEVVEVSIAFLLRNETGTLITF